MLRFAGGQLLCVKASGRASQHGRTLKRLMQKTGSKRCIAQMNMSNAEFIKPYTKTMRKGKKTVEHETDRNTAALIGIISRQNAEIARLLQENAKLKILLSEKEKKNESNKF